MKNNQYTAPEFFCVATTFLVSTALNAAGISPIKVTLSSGLDTNYVKISKGQLKVVEYKIQDMIGRPPSRTWLWSPTAPSYASRTNSLHQPDCSVYNQPASNPDSFALPPNQHCYFSIQIDGTEFAKTNSTIAQIVTQNYRPTFTNSNAIEYGPCLSEIIYTTLTPILPIIAVGSYYSGPPLVERPLLTLSQNLGNTWSFPESINAPVFTPDIPDLFSGKGVFYGASCSENICIAAGKGEDINFQNNPLVAVTQNSGDTWSYPASVTAPIFNPTNPYTYLRSGVFNAASCYKNTCIATGQYRDLSTTQRALLAVSQDFGSTWNYSNSISELVFSNPAVNAFNNAANLESASCYKNTCVTAGTYKDTNNITRPLAALSQDSGKTWTYPSLFNDPVFFPASSINSFQNNGYFVGASCSENTCIIVGQYEDTNNIQRPLLALSQDSGNTWVFPAAINDPVFTTNPFASGAFFGANCYKNTCVAVGSYIDTNGIRRPLLGLTKDSGNTWDFPESITTPMFAPDNSTNIFSDTGILRGISCYGTTCIAAGFYEDTNNVVRPLLAVSQDLGNIWTYPSSINAPVFTPTNTNSFVQAGVFSSASCNATTCIATGNYTSIARRPLLALSQDFGTTWTYPSSINETKFTPQNTNPFFNNGEFNSASASTSAPFLPNSLKMLNPRPAQEEYQKYIGIPTS